MSSVRPNRRAAGFTLIELLVVIGILGVLSAIAVGVFFKVRGNQQITVTEESLTKLNTALDQRWRVVLDKAGKEVQENSHQQNAAKLTNPNSPLLPSTAQLVSQLAGGDRDAARSVWTYMRLKNAFPQTFAEAKASIMAGGTTVLPPKTMFAKLPAVVAADTDPLPSEMRQSAAILYLLVTERGEGGVAAGEDVAGVPVGEVTFNLPNPPGGVSKHPVFKDSFGQPIAFIRWATNGDIADPKSPYIKRGSQSPDPLDPTGRLKLLLPTNKTAIATSLGLPDVSQFSGPLNWLPTLISAGPDGTFNGQTVTPGITTLLETGGADNLYGYKLRRTGQRGDN